MLTAIAIWFACSFVLAIALGKMLARSNKPLPSSLEA